MKSLFSSNNDDPKKFNDDSGVTGGFNVAVDGDNANAAPAAAAWHPQPAEDLDDFKRFYRELWKGNGKGSDDPFRKAQTERRVGDLGNLLTAFKSDRELEHERPASPKRAPNQDEEEVDDLEKTIARAQTLQKEQGIRPAEHAYALYPLLSGAEVKDSLKAPGKRDPSMADAEKWYQVQLKTRVRETYDTKSPEVMVLLRGTKVRVVEKRKRRVRIDSPTHGWVSLYTNDGWLILAPAWTQRWYRLKVQNDIHESVAMSSKMVARLSPGDVVHVCEFQGRRVRIDEPVIGWCSLMTKTGEILLEPSDAPGDIFQQHTVIQEKNTFSGGKATAIDFSLRKGERWRLVGYFPKNRLHLKLIKERIPGYHPTKKVGMFDAYPYLATGSSMMKFGKRGKPHFRIVQLSPDSSYLLWFSANKYMDQSRIPVNSINAVVMGQQTDNFKRMKWSSLSPCSFSILHGPAANQKSLDLVAKSSDEALLWVHALRKLVDMRKTYDFCQTDPESDYPRRRNSERIKTLLVDVVVGENFAVHHPGTMVEEESEDAIRNRVEAKLRDIKETLERVEFVMTHPSLKKLGEAGGFRRPTMRFLETSQQRWKDLHKSRANSEERLHKMECQLYRLEIDAYSLCEKAEVLLRDLKKRYLPVVEKERMARNAKISSV